MRFLMFFLMLTLGASAASAAVIHIPEDYPTLAAGIAGSATGDTLMLAAGTYHESNITIPHGLTIRNVPGTSVTLHGDDGPHRLFTAVNLVEPLRLTGITITHYLESLGTQGGAVRFTGTELHLQDCRFITNSIWPWDTMGSPGIAVYGGALWGSGQLFVSDCLFQDNRATGQYSEDDNGGAANGGAIYWSGDQNILRTTFLSNRANGENGGMIATNADGGNATGGAIYGGAVSLQGCSFESNRVCGGSAGGIGGAGASGTGGAVYATTVQTTACEFRDNNAAGGGGSDAGTGGDGRGGAVKCANFTGQQCVIAANHASGGGAFYNTPGSAYGGGLYCTTATLSSSLVCFNYADASGNVSAGAAGGGLKVANLTLESVTLHHNGAYAECPSGAALWSTNLEMSNCLITENYFTGWGPGYAVSVGNPPTVACTDIYGNDNGDWEGNLAELYLLDGNFSADPLYCNTDDFSLPGNSPCAPGFHPQGADCGWIGAGQLGCGEITDLSISLEETQLCLSWTPWAEGTVYNVYRLATPWVPPAEWVLLATQSLAYFCEPYPGTTAFYRVTLVLP